MAPKHRSLSIGHRSWAVVISLLLVVTVAPSGFAQDAFNDATDRIQVGTWTMGSTPPGNIAKVEALFWIYFNGAITNDDVTLELYEAGSMIGSETGSFSCVYHSPRPSGSFE